MLGVHGFHPSSKGFDMLHSNYKRYLSKHLSRKLSRTLSRKIKESLSQASQRFAATTLRAETLQLMQRTSFCHGSHSCAWGGQEMNQFPGLVAEDGCSEPSVSRGISKRHAFTHPWAGWVGENKNFSHCEPSDSEVQHVLCRSTANTTELSEKLSSMK